MDCDVGKGDFPNRCRSCSAFRNTLRSTLSRELKEVTKDHTSTSSHTCYCNLTPDEKDERLKNLHRSLLSAKQHSSALEAKFAAQIQAQSLPLQETDAADISSLIDGVKSLVEEKFPSDSPQRIFWEQQLLYKNKKQMRWHPYNDQVCTEFEVFVYFGLQSCTSQRCYPPAI